MPVNPEDYGSRLVHRLRAFLLLEKEKYTKYLKILNLQQDDIHREDTQALLCHQELAEGLLNEITIMQKSIRPLWADLETCGISSKHPELADLKSELDLLWQDALSVSQLNREAIEAKLSELDVRISRVRYPHKNSFSAGPAPVSKFINISA